MKDPATLLSTLTQAAAVFVAIVGGFLVSRLVAISSERDNLKRRHKEARDQLKHVTTAYERAHEDRLSTSRKDFARWVVGDLVGVAPESVDREALLGDNNPRGSSREEMGPYLEELITRVGEMTEEINAYLRARDTNLVTLEDLQERGLSVPDDEEDTYRKVVESVAAQLPEPPHTAYGISPGLLRAAQIVQPTYVALDAQRLDESIRREQELGARKRLLETDVERLRSEIALSGRPFGVTPAIVILALYSLLGIVAPVIVLTLHPSTLKWWEAWGLVALFVVGLFTVLGYVLWYARTLNDRSVIEDDP
jgi:hypothetical protein